MSLPSYSNLDDLINVYTERLDRETKNRNRVKKFYNDDESFDKLMERLIEKDYIRFEKFIGNVLNKKGKCYPSPWKIFFVIMDIVQNEGEEIRPFDTLTKMLPSRTLKYHGWTFSTVHGIGTLISIYNRENELVYRF